MPTSLKDILQKKKERAERADRPKIDWFKLPQGGSAKVAFLQELNEELADAKGPALYLVEHNSPQDFKRRGECTFDEDAGSRCFACEMNQEEPNNNWWAKTNFYVNVYVETKDDKPGEGSVKLLSRPISNKEGGFFDELLTWAIEENDGSVTGQTFTLSKGPEKTSPWTFRTSKVELNIPDNLELWSPEAITNKIEYDKQKSFYLPNGNKQNDDADEAQASTPKPKNEELSW